MDDAAVLDDPVGESLRGRHAHLARRHGRALSYRSAVATFSAVPLQPGADDWADLAALLGPDGFADMFSSPAAPPPDWAPAFAVDGVQMVGDPDRLAAAGPDPDVVELGEADVADMLDLVARTRPGPFRPETHRLGTYLGIREAGELVAMAGERLRPPGWTEISAVCTAPAARGRGLGARLVRAAAARIIGRGERPFLHVVVENAGAFELYRRLGFSVRRDVTFRGYRTPPA
ncbi:GNAT family N-acetyltransferase [Nocardioides sp. CER19]|uniref:GNAT family N-acetyltransferase n=1 Tax=Nocardioides sp. CER19 TaxID=3038538 RepID=UPI00244C596B|nr:GNAT family N-acetyltransferase [Nocardioides sp. CER19]MDH2415033.1 GNAT family N-acetyltransferase [Nocardioides sp. CER19]